MHEVKEKAKRKIIERPLPLVLDRGKHFYQILHIKTPSIYDPRLIIYLSRLGGREVTRGGEYNTLPADNPLISFNHLSSLLNQFWHNGITFKATPDVTVRTKQNNDEYNQDPNKEAVKETNSAPKRPLRKVPKEYRNGVLECVDYSSLNAEATEFEIIIGPQTEYVNSGTDSLRSEIKQRNFDRKNSRKEKRLSILAKDNLDIKAIFNPELSKYIEAQELKPIHVRNILVAINILLEYQYIYLPLTLRLKLVAVIPSLEKLASLHKKDIETSIFEAKERLGTHETNIAIAQDAGFGTKRTTKLKASLKSGINRVSEAFFESDAAQLNAVQSHHVEASKKEQAARDAKATDEHLIKELKAKHKLLEKFGWQETKYQCEDPGYPEENKLEQIKQELKYALQDDEKETKKSKYQNWIKKYSVATKAIDPRLLQINQALWQIQKRAYDILYVIYNGEIPDNIADIVLNFRIASFNPAVKCGFHLWPKDFWLPIDEELKRSLIQKYKNIFAKDGLCVFDHADKALEIFYNAALLLFQMSYQSVTVSQIKDEFKAKYEITDRKFKSEHLLLKMSNQLRKNIIELHNKLRLNLPKDDRILNPISKLEGLDVLTIKELLPNLLDKASIPYKEFINNKTRWLTIFNEAPFLAKLEIIWNKYNLLVRQFRAANSKEYKALNKQEQSLATSTLSPMEQKFVEYREKYYHTLNDFLDKFSKFYEKVYGAPLDENIFAEVINNQPISLEYFLDVFYRNYMFSNDYEELISQHKVLVRAYYAKDVALIDIELVKYNAFAKSIGEVENKPGPEASDLYVAKLLNIREYKPINLDAAVSPELEERLLADAENKANYELLQECRILREILYSKLSKELDFRHNIPSEKFLAVSQTAFADNVAQYEKWTKNTVRSFQLASVLVLSRYPRFDILFANKEPLIERLVTERKLLFCLQELVAVEREICQDYTNAKLLKDKLTNKLSMKSDNEKKLAEFVGKKRQLFSAYIKTLQEQKQKTKQAIENESKKNRKDQGEINKLTQQLSLLIQQIESQEQVYSTYATEYDNDIFNIEKTIADLKAEIIILESGIREEEERISLNHAAKVLECESNIILINAQEHLRYAKYFLPLKIFEEKLPDIVIKCIGVSNNDRAYKAIKAHAVYAKGYVDVKLGVLRDNFLWRYLCKNFYPLYFKCVDTIRQPTHNFEAALLLLKDFGGNVVEKLKQEISEIDEYLDTKYDGKITELQAQKEKPNYAMATLEGVVYTLSGVLTFGIAWGLGLKRFASWASNESIINKDIARLEKEKAAEKQALIHGIESFIVAIKNLIDNCRDLTQQQDFMDSFTQKLKKKDKEQQNRLNRQERLAKNAQLIRQEAAEKIDNLPTKSIPLIEYYGISNSAADRDKRVASDQSPSQDAQSRVPAPYS